MKDKKKKKHTLRNYLIEGILITFPLSITVYLIYFLVRWVSKKLSFVRDFFPDSWQNFWYVNAAIDISALIIIIIFIVLIGLLAQTLLGKWLGKLFGRIIESLPGVGFLYKSFQQLFKAFFSFQAKDRFSRTVLIQYPHPGIWSIAFMTGDAPQEFTPDKTEGYYTVFMPSTPNPTTGFMMIIPKKDVVFLDIPIEEALKIMMSGGLLRNTPEEQEDED